MNMKEEIRKMLRETLYSESVKGGVYNVFHGSETNITSFSDEFVGANEAVDQEGPGIYFSSSEDDASSYGKNVYNVTLTPRVLFDASPINAKKMIPIIKKLVTMLDDWEMEAQNYDENPKIGLTKYIQSTLKYNNNEKDCILQVWIDFYRYNPVEYVRNCVKLGIDGIVVDKEFNDVKHFIIYNPAIIKTN